MSTSSSESWLGGDPVVTSSFLLEIDGVEVGLFKEVRGLEITVPTEEIREGGQNGFTHRVPGRVTYPNVVFKRGVTESNVLFQWLQKTSGEGFAGAGNKLERVTGAVTVLDHNLKRLRAWELLDVFPVRWKGPDFSADNASPLEEELEIAHHGFRAKDVS